MHLAIASSSSRFLSTFELDLPDQTALSRTIRPAKNRQDGHASGCRPIQLPDHTVIGFTRSAGDKAHFEFAAIRLFPHIQIPLPVPIEHRNAGLECFHPGASAAVPPAGAGNCHLYTCLYTELWPSSGILAYRLDCDIL